jgi:hypothetical protein
MKNFRIKYFLIRQLGDFVFNLLVKISCLQGDFEGCEDILTCD